MGQQVLSENRLNIKEVTLFSLFFYFLQGYHRPNHYIATQGKNKTLKIDKATQGWDAWGCLFVWRPAQVLTNISPNIPVVVYMCTLLACSLMLSHVCAQEMR